MGSALNAAPYSFRAIGLWDALDGSGVPPGACFSLQNLVHDITTPFLWTGRPAATALTSFAGFSDPSCVSVAMALGSRIYGMVGTSLTPGYDQPFCYDTATSSFVTISGVTSANVPATQPLTGAWVPPTMDAIGSKIVVTHPGFSGISTNFFGVVDLSNLAAPAWSSKNTSTNALPSVPIAVKNFNNRAYFACGHLSYYSDALAPDTITNSTQFLTHGGKGSDIVAYGGLPAEQTTGGILAALIAFKAEGYWQVAGDTTTNNLTNNGPFVPGCAAPRSVAQGPAGFGLLYVANDGVHWINGAGVASPQPLPGVRYPFQAAYVPSRIAAGFNNTVYRVGLQTITNALTGQNGFVEYWYDFEISQWSGPHTWSSDCIVPLGSTFVCANNRSLGTLYQSAVDPSATATFTELGVGLTYKYQSSLLPQDEGMAMKSVIESQIDIDFAATGMTAFAQIISATGGIVGTATVSAVTGTYWNQFLWNQANWSSAIYGLRSYNLDWTAPVVYKKASFALLGALTPGLRLGPARMRTEELEYMNEQSPA